MTAFFSYFVIVAKQQAKSLERGQFFSTLTFQKLFTVLDYSTIVDDYF